MLQTVKSKILSIARRRGYDIVKIPKLHVGSRSPYDLVVPAATYAPWNSDDLFLSTYTAVKGHTLVDLYRCWELWCLAEQTAKLPGNIIEIGVWRGGTGAIMAKKAALCAADDVVYLCDTFQGVVKTAEHDSCYQGGEHADTSRQIVEELLHERLQLNNVRILAGIFPDETAHLIEDQQARFRLCHIDVDVYQSAKDVLEWVWPRLVVGGIVVYDDYGFSQCPGITRVVNEQSAEQDRLLLHNLNGHALVVKIPQR